MSASLLRRTKGQLSGDESRASRAAINASRTGAVEPKFFFSSLVSFSRFRCSATSRLKSGLVFLLALIAYLFS